MHELMEECKSDLKTVSYDSAHEESMVDSNEVIHYLMTASRFT